MEVLDGFCESREWVVSRRHAGGLNGARLMDVLEALGVGTQVGDNSVMAESFFAQLRTEAEEMELLERLLPLSEALGQYLEETPVTESRQPLRLTSG